VGCEPVRIYATAAPRIPWFFSDLTRATNPEARIKGKNGTAKGHQEGGDTAIPGETC